MAAPFTLDGFSIREYTARIRAEDVEKCWPFDGNPNEMSREAVEELLPPLTCKKLGWWGDELEKAVSEKPLDEAEVVLEKDGDDDKVSKTKTRRRRKRSIVEIFAVAPQIESDDDEILANVRKKKRKLMEIGKKGSTLKKEKTRKFNSSMQLALVGKLKSSVKGKKKLISKSKSSSKHNNVKKIVFASKLTKQNQKPTGKSVQGILKRCGRVTGKRSAVKSGDPKKRPQEVVDKHVRFSGKDHILGGSSSTGSLQEPETSEVLSDNMVLSSLLEKEDIISPTEREELNERSEEVMKEKEVLDKRDGDIVPSTFWSSDSGSTQERGQGLSDEFVRQTRDSQHQENLHSFSHDKPTSPHNPSFPGISWVRDSVTMDSTSANSELSTLSLGKTHDSQDVPQQLNGYNRQHHPYLELSPKDLMTRISFLMDSNKKKTASCGKKFIDDDFVGLPLNSQGELIKLNQLRKESTAGNLSVKSFIHVEKGHDCTETTLPKENHDIPSRVSQPTHQLDLDLNKMSISTCACNHYNQTQIQIDKENNKLAEKSDSGGFSITQPTMRLMGKDVTVGRNNKEVQDFEDDKVWTDKNVINEQRRDALVGTSNLETEAMMNISSGKWNETRNQSLRPPGVPFRPYSQHMNAVDQQFCHTYHNWQPSKQLSMENQSVQVLPFSRSLPSEETMSRNFGMPSEFPNLSSHIRSFAPCQCTRPNSTQLLYEQGLAHGSSCFRFPFASPPCGKCAQQSQPQTLPHWMLNMSQQKGSPFVPSGYGTRAQNHPFSTPLPSQYFTSMVSQPLHHARHFSHGQNSSDTYQVQQPPVPAPPGFILESSTNASYRNRLYLKNILKPQTVVSKELDRAKRTKTRPRDKIDNSRKYPTNHFLDLSRSLIHKQGAPRHDVNSNNQMEVEPSLGSSIHNNRASVLDANVDPGRYAKNSSSTVVNNSSMDTTARSGPTKLSAGAKHILKPSPNPDQDNSRLIHSTIPFGLVSNSDKVLELQKKPSKIYKL